MPTAVLSPLKPGLTGIILAAGSSTRMGDRNKLFLMLDGRWMIEHVISNAIDSGLSDIIVVTGHQHGRLKRMLDTYHVRIVYNAKYSLGMGSSISFGIQNAKECDGFLIIPGDMPLISRDTYSLIKNAFDPEKAIVPVYGDRRGHPVLFPDCFREQLLALPPGHGARCLLKSQSESVSFISVDDPGIHVDVDTIDDYQAIRGLQSDMGTVR